MSSASKTPNLDLPQWVETEPLERTDMNDAFSILDNLWQVVYPVGCLFETTDAAFNPQTHFGGTWEQYGAGRVTVGYSSGETEFNAGGKTGGAKTHTLTKAQIPTDLKASATASTTYTAGSWAVTLTGNTTTVPLVLAIDGGGQAHNNLQPYITVFRWRRTA